MNLHMGDSGDVCLPEFTFWLFDIAIENGPIADDVPIKNLHLEGIFHACLEQPDGI